MTRQQSTWFDQIPIRDSAGGDLTAFDQRPGNADFVMETLIASRNNKRRLVKWSWLGSLSGSIFAALILTFLPELLRSVPTGAVGDIRMIIFPTLLILMMIFRPQGLFGRKELTLDTLRGWVKR